MTPFSSARRSLSAILRNLLGDDRLREDGGQVNGAERLHGARVQVGRRRRREIRQDVVPAVRQVGLVQEHFLHLAPPRCARYRDATVWRYRAASNLLRMSW